MSALELRGAVAILGGRTVLDGVDLNVETGEVVALVGPNGAGKSSVMRALAGLLPLSGGEARLGGEALGRLSHAMRADRAGYLPQERRIAWNMPALEVAALGAPSSAADALDAARAALNEVEAGHLANRGVAEMSGGERARVLLARVFATGAKALMLDEPVAGLDPEAQLLVLEAASARARQGHAVLISLHDLALAGRHADRVIVMDAGRVATAGPPLEALTADVLARVFGLEARWVDGPDGPLLSTARYSEGSGVGVVSAGSPVE